MSNPMGALEFLKWDWAGVFAGLEPEEIASDPAWQVILAEFGADMVAALYRDRLRENGGEPTGRLLREIAQRADSRE